MALDYLKWESPSNLVFWMMYQGLFLTIVGYEYRTQSSSLSFEKKIFLLEMVENDIRLGGTSLAHLEDSQTCLLLYLFI